MTSYSKPLPDVDDEIAAPFWHATREHRLAFQHCGDCGYVRWPPATYCPECLSDAVAWRNVSGRGRVWSFAVYHQTPDPDFGDQLPYTIGAVVLDEGPMLITRILGDPSARRIDERVQAHFLDVTDRVTLVYFDPIGDVPA